jgi:DNA-binding NarL/FixJ family response regulator
VPERAWEFDSPLSHRSDLRIFVRRPSVANPGSAVLLTLAHRTSRSRSVSLLALVAQGLTNPEIGFELDISDAA